MGEWVEDRVSEGCGLICIDPITAVEANAKPWVADLKFLIRAKTAVRRTGARLILVTHPKKGRKGAIGMEELAGGGAYSRFSHTVLRFSGTIRPRRSRCGRFILTYHLGVRSSIEAFT